MATLPIDLLKDWDETEYSSRFERMLTAISMFGRKAAVHLLKFQEALADQPTTGIDPGSPEGDRTVKTAIDTATGGYVLPPGTLEDLERGGHIVMRHTCDHSAPHHPRDGLEACRACGCYITTPDEPEPLIVRKE